MHVVCGLPASVLFTKVRDFVISWQTKCSEKLNSSSVVETSFYANSPKKYNPHAITQQGRTQDSPYIEAPTRGEATYNFTKFSQKLHEIEKILVHR